MLTQDLKLVSAKGKGKGKNAYYYAFFELTHLEFLSLILVLFREKNSIVNDGYLPNFEVFMCF